MQFFILIVMVMMFVLAASMSFGAILPLDDPAMAIKVDAGSYVVHGRTLQVSETSFLPIEPSEEVRVLGEEQVMTDIRPRAYCNGVMLLKTLGTVDTGTRMFHALDPGSVRVRSTDGSRRVYEEGKDYFLDHEWGGLSRIEGGTIPKDASVRVDYIVYKQRIEAIQVTSDGKVSVKKGVSVEVCPRAAEADTGCTVLANIYVPFRTKCINAENIYPMPAKDITWRSFIKVTGRQYLRKTIASLRGKKPFTIVCWGDSVTAGGSARPHDKCYVELLRAQLKAAYPETSINVINAGIGGSSTESRKAGFDKEVLAYSPDLITVEFVNDFGLSAEQIRANYDGFVAQARQKLPNVEFIIITPHFMMPEWMGNWNAYITEVRAAVLRNKVALADTSNIWGKLKTVGIPYVTLLANLINHPDNLGHEFFAESLMELLHP